jgi:ABC-type transport system substrate-binding protein
MEEAKWYLLKALPLANEGFMSKTTMDTLIMIQNKWDEIGIELSLSLISLIDVLNQKYESLKEKSTT